MNRRKTIENEGVFLAAEPGRSFAALTDIQVKRREEAMKKNAVVLCLVLLLALIPCAGLALTTYSPMTDGYNGRTPGNEVQARLYKIQFQRTGLTSESGMRIYTAPSSIAARSAGIYPLDDVRFGGKDGTWQLVYCANAGEACCVGWMQDNGYVNDNRNVNFAYWPVELEWSCMLTDDPMYEERALAFAEAGETLTYLAYYCSDNGSEYAYVKGELNGRPLCGFIPFDAIGW